MFTASHRLSKLRERRDEQWRKQETRKRKRKLMELASPAERRRVVGVEVMGLAPDVEPLPHQALGPRQLQVRINTTMWDNHEH